MRVQSSVEEQDGQSRAQPLQRRTVFAAQCGMQVDKDGLRYNDHNTGDDYDDDLQVGEQEREEEEEDREEARRIDAELAQRLEGAFDDLDFDDDDDSSLCSPPGGFNHVGLSPFIFA